jgi:deoxyribose-phosphate aldolase
MQKLDVAQLAILVGEEIQSRLGGRPLVDHTIASYIDHTILRPDATEADVRRVCAEAFHYGFAAVCVNPYWVSLVASELKGSAVKTCTVAGFPLGANATEVKVAEAELAVRCGAQEVDMVINAGALRSGDYERVRTDISGVVQACHRGNAITKVILENALLDDAQKAIACALCKVAGADFVKTSTGFASSGATAEDVALMRRVVGKEMGVKAAGGIRTLEDLRRMVAAGASRVGASASVSIMEAAAGGQ